MYTYTSSAPTSGVQATVAIGGERYREPQPIATPNKLIRPLGISGSQDRTGLNPTQMTPVGVVGALQSAASGDLGPMMTMFKRMESADTLIQGHRRSLEGFLISSPMRLSVPETGTSESKRAAQIGAEVLRRLSKRYVVMELVQGYLSGLRIHEVVWRNVSTRTLGDATLPVGLELISPSRYMLSLKRDAPDFGGLRIRTEDERDGVPVANYPSGQIVVTSDAGKGAHVDLSGVYRSVLPWHLVRTQNRQWWSELNEVWGLPTMVGYTDDAAGSENYIALERHLKQVQRWRYAILSSSTEIEAKESATSGSDTYAHMKGWAAEEITLAMMGQLETSSGGKYGSNAKANVHNVVRYEIGLGIAQMVCETISEIIAHAVRLTEGEDFPEEDLPTAYIAIPRPDQMLLKAQTMREAIEMGVRVPVQYAHDELGIAVAREGEAVLSQDTLAKKSEATLPQSADPIGTTEEEEPEEDEDA